MEIQSKNGSKTLLSLKQGVKKIAFGRGLGFDSADRTVSRRHISFQPDHKDQTRVHFHVIGKNPIWVHNAKNDEIGVYRSLEKGEMESGDSFCVSAKKPVWFNLKRIESEDEDKSGMKRELEFDGELAENLQSSHGLSGIGDLELELGDISNIDPVKEFGFVVLGHEFDYYPKKMIRDIKNWDWFIEEPRRKDSEDDEDGERKRNKGERRKRKKGDGNDGDDDDWTDESEEDAELIKKLRKVQKPKYSTRSKNHGQYSKGATASKSSRPKDTTEKNKKHIEDEEEDDDTLGGFIVGDEDLEVEKEEGFEDEEEEEEFEEDNHEEE